MGEQSEIRHLREWTPMSRLLQQIPLKAQRGLFTYDLNLTCIDCLPDFLALGTNVGLVYWYDRQKDELQRLRCENTSPGIVCIRAVSTVDYMVAAGSEDGNVTVFQIPKRTAPTIPRSPKYPENRQIERFTISGLHLGPVSALEWSPNGMNLFSGDLLGMVVLTEIDFYMHLSKSREILNEKYEVVQLSYTCGIPHGKQLLVSTVYRSTLCSWCQDERVWKVSQLGQRERKALGQFGGTFHHSVDGTNHCDVIFASRPGLRLWQAALDGVVHHTLIFKDALMCPHPSIMLVNPVPSRFGAKPSVAERKQGEASRKCEEERVGGSRSDCQQQLGYLHPYHNGILVAHWKGSNGCILVLDTEDTGIVASVKTGPGGLRSIISVAVTPASFKVSGNHCCQESANSSVEHASEIFVLEGGRSLIRISSLPDYSYSQGLEGSADRIGIRSLFSLPPLLSSPPLLLKDLTTSLLELTTGSGIGHFRGEREFGTQNNERREDEASSSETVCNTPTVDDAGPKRGDCGIVMADEALEGPLVCLPFQEATVLVQLKKDAPEQCNNAAGEVLGRPNMLLEEVLYKRKRKKKDTAAVGCLERTGGSEGSSSRSTGSEEDVPDGPSQGAVGGAGSRGEDGGQRRHALEQSSRRWKKSEMVVAVNLRSSVLEEGHVGGVGSWMPSMPLAPDLRSPTSIRQDIESKGELLAKLLDLKPIVSHLPVKPSVEQQEGNVSGCQLPSSVTGSCSLNISLGEVKGSHKGPPQRNIDIGSRALPMECRSKIVENESNAEERKVYDLNGSNAEDMREPVVPHEISDNEWEIID